MRRSIGSRRNILGRIIHVFRLLLLLRFFANTSNDYIHNRVAVAPISDRWRHIKLSGYTHLVTESAGARQSIRDFLDLCIAVQVDVVEPTINFAERFRL